ncbi:hypothetical protein IC232_06070 [Microvirga sp. BT688]|uniref:hypothetical protein n=1 Tax=Microvirga sp. TaxID=1873136 RepID=UPI0016887BE4|nr:hypothetical protein [Microvirga sp.]MBD2746264.1 hypothetical protein [Microvirga sp.]
MAAPVLWGSEFSVDLKQTDGVQSDTSIIAFADGSFLAVWVDYKVGGDIVGQFFSADGTQKGDAFHVTHSLDGQQSMPQAAILSDGRYVVAWSSSNGADNPGVRARIVDQNGHGGDDLYVGETGFIGAPSLSVSALGDGFVVSYASSASPFSSSNIHAYSFAANGAPIASNVRVNGPSGKAGYEPQIVELNNGRFAVFFEGEGYADDPDGGIRCRVLSVAGDEIVPEFRVPATVKGSQWSPGAVRLNDGRIAVVWQHMDEATGDKSGSSLRGASLIRKIGRSDKSFRSMLRRKEIRRVLN